MMYSDLSRFEHLMVECEVQQPGGQDTLVDRKEKLVKYIGEMIGHAKFDLTRELRDYGVDSLLATQLTIYLKRELKVHSVSQLEILNGASATDLLEALNNAA
jgi:hypothetical protein